MRLTTVTRMSLPSGVVHRFATHVTPVQGEATPPSFDQARHASLGRRSGSWMAVAFALPFPADREMVARAWLAVVSRHGTLQTVLDGDAGGGEELRLQPVAVRPTGWRVEEPGDGEDPRAVLRRVFDQVCCPFATPSHALCLVEPEDPDERPVVVIGLDHSHVDAWSLLVLLRDFCSCLDDLACGLEPGTCLPPAAAFAEHTRELAQRPPAPPRVHDRWAQILAGGDMPVFPLDLGDISTPRPEVVEVRDVLDPDGVAALDAAATADGVRMVALAMAEMTTVLRRHGGVGLRAVLPVHSRHHEKWHDSVGWFITNSVVECSDPDPKACAAAVRDAVELGSHALGPVLEPYGGMPHTPGMFAISWLDHRRLPIDVDLSLAPQHVSAAIRTDGVMVWFVVNGSGLHVRCRYPDTARARVTVGGWLDELCAGLVRRSVDGQGPRARRGVAGPRDPDAGERPTTAPHRAAVPA
ncbi:MULTISPECIES: condensation domain-containing protein [unclassified Dietzia]|uniref:condensation domain-containing protein n=1 Tax=unclassified Dietzia TaxID=2617939 RepID=UPI000D31F3D0|nr:MULTISPECIES: condensation domain-containing protein [unclassified Dietzia]